jgi:methylamine dehydrogenase accessory protein MauD
MTLAAAAHAKSKASKPAATRTTLSSIAASYERAGYGRLALTGDSLFAVQGWWTVSYLVLWLLVIVLCVVVVALARQIGTLYLRLGPRGALELDDEGPPLGEAPQPLEGSDGDGRPVHIGGPGDAQLLMFVSPGCHVCDQALPSLPVVAHDARLSPIVITDADPEETALVFATKAVAAPVVAGIEIAQHYEVPGTPYVVVLDDMGVVRAKGTVNNLEQMEGLVTTARKRMSGADEHQQRRAS